MIYIYIHVYFVACFVADKWVDDLTSSIQIDDIDNLYWFSSRVALVFSATAEPSACWRAEPTEANVVSPCIESDCKCDEKDRSSWMCFKKFIPTYFTIRIRVVMPKPALLVQFISIHTTRFKFVWVPYSIPKDSIHKSPENTQPHKLTKTHLQTFCQVYLHEDSCHHFPWK